MAQNDLGTASKLVGQDIAATSRAQADIKQRDTDIEAMLKDMASRKFDRPPPTLDVQPFQAPQMEDPVKAWGKPTSILAMIASFATRRPLTTAIMSATAAMNAVQSKNASEYQTAFDQWKTNTDFAFKRADWENEQYHNALEMFEKDFDRGMQTITTLATLNKDEAMMATMQSGNISDIASLVNARANQTRAGLEAMEKAATIGEQVGEWKKWKEQNPKATLDQVISAHQRIFPSTASVGYLRETGRIKPATQAEISSLKDRFDKADADFRATMSTKMNPSAPEVTQAAAARDQAWSDYQSAVQSAANAPSGSSEGGPAAQKYHVGQVIPGGTDAPKGYRVTKLTDDPDDPEVEKIH